jgi:hypothetical protein
MSSCNSSSETLPFASEGSQYMSTRYALSPKLGASGRLNVAGTMHKSVPTHYAAVREEQQVYIQPMQSSGEKNGINDGDEAQRGAVDGARDVGGQKRLHRPLDARVAQSHTTPVRGPGTVSRARECVHSHSPHGLGLVQLLEGLRLKEMRGSMADRTSG